MEEKNKLYMVVLGATPPGRLTEQHDVFFGIAKSLRDLIPMMKAFWPEAKGNIHIDSWREVTIVDGHAIEVMTENTQNSQQLFFLNLGGYKPGELEECHYKMLAVGQSMAEAVKKSKQTVFYKHFGFKGAESHVDEKFGVDVDDLHVVDAIARSENPFYLRISPTTQTTEDALHIGYLKIEKLAKTI